MPPGPSQSKIAKFTRVELTKRMGAHRGQVECLFRLDHNSRLDRLEAEFKMIDVPANIEVPLKAA